MNEKTLKDTTVFDGHLIRVHVDDVELDNGMVAKREIVSHPGGVSVAILTEKNELLFVKQFRCPYQEELLELPLSLIHICWNWLRSPPGCAPRRSCQR